MSDLIIVQTYVIKLNPSPINQLQIMIEIAIIASDIQEVLGSAIAIAILSNNAGIFFQ